MKRLLIATLLILSTANSVKSQEFIDMGAFENIQQGVKPSASPSRNQRVIEQQKFCRYQIGYRFSYYNYARKVTGLDERGNYLFLSACKNKSSMKVTKKYWERATQEYRWFLVR